MANQSKFRTAIFPITFWVARRTAPTTHPSWSNDFIKCDGMKFKVLKLSQLAVNLKSKICTLCHCEEQAEA